jgi:hypothetical protein
LEIVVDEHETGKVFWDAIAKEIAEQLTGAMCHTFMHAKFTADDQTPIESVSVVVGAQEHAKATIPTEENGRSVPATAELMAQSRLTLDRREEFAKGHLATTPANDPSGVDWLKRYPDPDREVKWPELIVGEGLQLAEGHLSLRQSHVANQEAILRLHWGGGRHRKDCDSHHDVDEHDGERAPQPRSMQFEHRGDDQPDQPDKGDRVEAIGRHDHEQTREERGPADLPTDWFREFHGESPKKSPHPFAPRHLSAFWSRPLYQKSPSK